MGRGSLRRGLASGVIKHGVLEAIEKSMIFLFKPPENRGFSSSPCLITRGYLPVISHRPCQMGLGRLISNKQLLFSGSKLISQRAAQVNWRCGKNKSEGFIDILGYHWDRSSQKKEEDTTWTWLGCKMIRDRQPSLWYIEWYCCDKQRSFQRGVLVLYLNCNCLAGPCHFGFGESFRFIAPHFGWWITIMQPLVQWYNWIYRDIKG